MDCRSGKNFMMKYFDGSCSEAEEAQLKLHLNSCKKCSASFDSLEEAFGAIRMDEAELVDPLPDFEKKVMDKIISAGLTHKKKPDNHIILMYSVVSMLVVLSSIMVFTGTYYINIIENFAGFFSVSGAADFYHTVLSIMLNTYEAYKNAYLQMLFSSVYLHNYAIIILIGIFLTVQTIYSSPEKA